MPTPTKGPRLGGGPAHERLILANLATALFEHDQITTTQAKAKRLRPLAERLITFAKRGDLHSRRKVMTVVRDKSVVHRLFTQIGPDMAQRPGGYTRITKIAPRKGDNAPMAVIELVREPTSARKATVAEAEAATRRTSKTATAPAPVQRPAEPADQEPQDEYGPDSAAPLADGSAPEGFTVKGNKNSMKYHTTDSQWYEQTEAEVWFKTAEAAEAAGFSAPGSHIEDTQDAEEMPAGEYGPDSAAPLADGSAPEGFTVKGNKNSMKYHTTDSQWYEQTEAEVWFKTAEAAEAAGFSAPGGSSDGGAGGEES